MPDRRSAFPLRRAAATLRDGPLDLLVVGGGIYGAWIACDAAQRGLSVALVEARDWGAGTSSASSKLIHGGLRYLEHFEFGLVRESLRERRTLTQVAPHLVRPLRFALPVWRGDPASRLKLEAGLTTYDLLAGAGQPVARHRRYGASALRQRFPFMQADGLRGGFDYGDCQEDDARLTLEVVAAAQAAGAQCANRVTAESLLEADGRVIGAVLRDVETGQRFERHAAAVVTAAGPWSRALLGGAAPAMKLVKGVHLVLPAIAGCDQAFLLTAPHDGRVFFVIPWYGRTLLGTTEAEVNDPSQAQVTPAERRYLLDAAATRLPGLGWRESAVLAEFAGVRTLQADPAGSLSAVTREFDLLQPRPGLWLPLGGKYTTARSDAESVVDALLRDLRRPPVASRTACTLLPGAHGRDDAATPEERCAALLNHSPALSAATVEHLLRRYGRRAAQVVALTATSPALAQPLHAELPFIAAELVVARRDEMARDADDALRRRLPLDLLAARGPWRDAAAALFEHAATA